MRTTVDIDEALLERAKRLALKEKQTLGAVVGQALAAYLGGRRQAGKDPPFELIVAGSARGRFPTLAEIAAVEEEDEAQTLAIPARKRDAAP
jgi:predicted transcriptional regulator